MCACMGTSTGGLPGQVATGASSRPVWMVSEMLNESLLKSSPYVQGQTQFASSLRLRTARWRQTIVSMVSAFSCIRPESSPTLFWTIDHHSGWPIDRQNAICSAFATQPNSRCRIRRPAPPLCGLSFGQNQSMVLGCHLEFYCDGAYRCI